MWKYAGIFLLLLHLFLFVWSAGGMAEWLLPSVPWPSYSNSLFPRGLLFFHWTAVLFASSAFIYGYLFRWPLTPHALLAGYTMMALVCLIETFGYMTSPNRYLAMAAEYLAYVLILIILFKTEFRSMHFSASG